MRAASQKGPDFFRTVSSGAEEKSEQWEPREEKNRVSVCVRVLRATTAPTADVPFGPPPAAAAAAAHRAADPLLPSEYPLFLNVARY